MRNFLLVILGVLVISGFSNGLPNIFRGIPPCGDWIPYENEKCIKLVERAGLQTKQEAEVLCKSFELELGLEDTPTLVTIKTEEKQTFLNKFLFGEHAAKTLDNVWLGLDLEKDGEFRWTDGRNLLYTNWVNESMETKERNCVQMESGEGSYKAGKWVRVNCKKRNSVLCERMQPISTAELHKIVVNLQLEVEINRNESEKTILNAKREGDQKLSDAQKEYELKLNDHIKKANNEINDLRKESEQKLTDAKKEGEQKLTEHIKKANQETIDVKKEAEQKLSDAKKESELKLTNVKEEYEKKLKEAEKATDQKIIQAKKESEQKLNDKFAKANQEVSTMNAKLTEANQQIASLKNSPVPLGFIYVQLPGRDPPTSLWPKTNWKDISTEYAGLFFRVVGGGAAAFGAVQEDNTRRIDQVFNAPEGKYINPLHLPIDGSWSDYAYTGSDSGNRRFGLRFRVTPGEIRPRNKAVKIWQRIK